MNQQNMNQKHYRFPVVIEHDGNGYFAFCPELDGCYTQGANYDEVIANIRAAIRLHIEDRIANGEEIPHAGDIMVAALDVAV